MKKILTATADAARASFLYRWYKWFIVDSMTTIKRSGIKTFIRERGWKMVALVIAYYLVRDTILYIIIPYLVARKIL